MRWQQRAGDCYEINSGGFMSDSVRQQIVISGVGGQGVLFVTRLLAEAAIAKLPQTLRRTREVILPLAG